MGLFQSSFSASVLQIKWCQEKTSTLLNYHQRLWHSLAKARKLPGTAEDPAQRSLSGGNPESFLVFISVQWAVPGCAGLSLHRESHHNSGHGKCCPECLWSCPYHQETSRSGSLALLSELYLFLRSFLESWSVFLSSGTGVGKQQTVTHCEIHPPKEDNAEQPLTTGHSAEVLSSDLFFFFTLYQKNCHETSSVLTAVLIPWVAVRFISP